MFNRFKDRSEVEQFGFVDLNTAFDKGVIPSAVSFDDSSFNGVSNPGTLISRSQDVFDGLRKAEYVKRSLAALSSKEREKVEKQVEKSVDAAGGVTE